MIRSSNYRFLCFTLGICLCLFSLTLKAQESSPLIPDELNDILGTYIGAWTSYGIDANGEIVEKAAWTDTITVKDPVVEENRAYATTIDKMYFEGGYIPPMTVEGKEGYLLDEDGNLGDYFFETYGQVYILQKLSENTWAYTAPAGSQELGMLGFTNVVWAQHALLKVVTYQTGTETHRITRVTTVNWKDSEGKDQWIQYVSLKGYHKRQ